MPSFKVLLPSFWITRLLEVTGLIVPARWLMSRRAFFVYIAYFLVASHFYLIPIDWSFLFKPGLAQISDSELLDLQNGADWRRDHPSHLPPDLAAEPSFSVAVHLVRNRPHLFANNTMSSRATIEAYRRMLFGYEDLLRYLKAHSQNEYSFRKALSAYAQWKLKQHIGIIILLCGGYVVMGTLLFCRRQMRMCGPDASTTTTNRSPALPLTMILLLPLYPTIGVGGSSWMTWTEHFSYYFSPAITCIPFGFHYHSPMCDAYDISMSNPIHLLWLVVFYDTTRLNGFGIGGRAGRFFVWLVAFGVLLIVPSLPFIPFTAWSLILALFPAGFLALWAAHFRSTVREHWTQLWFVVVGFVSLYAQLAFAQFWTFYETGFS